MARAIMMNSRTSIRRSSPSYFTPPLVKLGMLQEVFNLDEGPVMPTFSADFSATSYKDLKAYFDLFLRKAKRQVDRRASEAKQSGDPDDAL